MSICTVVVAAFDDDDDDDDDNNDGDDEEEEEKEDDEEEEREDQVCWFNVKIGSCPVNLFRIGSPRKLKVMLCLKQGW